MKPPKINLLDPRIGVAPTRRRFSFWKGALIGLIAIAVTVPVMFSLASVRLLDAASAINPNNQGAEKVSIIEQVRRLVGNSEKKLRGEERDRVNILVLGEGGEGHDGPHLTDTILFVTFKPSTSQVGILSLPRDLWIPMPDGGQNKINAVNAWAEKDAPRSGGEATRKAVAALLDQPIDYYVRVDFSAFKTLIDDVGGVTVNVERSFTDFAYPTDNALYKKVHFDKGWQTMDGNTALEYVRSRHGNAGEGSDFARSRRQQKVMLALKEKLVSFDTLLNPSRVASVLETLQTHVISDMELWEIVKLAKGMRAVDTSKLTHRVLDDDAKGPLYASSITVSNGDAYVLLPRKSDWSEIRRIAARVLEAKPEPQDAAEEARPARVEIQNGTQQAGLAKKTQDLLAKVGYDIVRIGNAEDRTRERTIVYDLTNGGMPEELQTIKNLLGAEVGLTLPGYLSSDVTPSNIALSNGQQPSSGGTDFLVVLGKNAVN
ncbi:MAG TPA: LCP family protein [Candidatus Baltobacteraceae bacterium]|nr:LCP family protein [Candidatus Baltobacteraceae bacterium]